MSQSEKNDVFKDVFKFYKRRDRPLDLSNVVNFEDPQKWSERIEKLEGSDSDNDDLESLDLKNNSEWKIYKLLPECGSSAGDGIYYIGNPFTDCGNHSMRNVHLILY